MTRFQSDALALTTIMSAAALGVIGTSAALKAIQHDSGSSANCYVSAHADGATVSFSKSDGEIVIASNRAAPAIAVFSHSNCARVEAHRKKRRRHIRVRHSFDREQAERIRERAHFARERAERARERAQERAERARERALRASERMARSHERRIRHFEGQERQLDEVRVHLRRLDDMDFDFDFDFDGINIDAMELNGAEEAEMREALEQAARAMERLEMDLKLNLEGALAELKSRSANVPNN